MELNFNLDKLIEIIVRQGRIYSDFIIKKEIKLLGIVFRQEGIYDTAFNYFRGNIKKWLKENSEAYIENNKIIIKSSCTLIFQDEIYYEKFFDSFKDAKTFSKKIKKEAGRWFEIKIIN
jgi:hypothetical protein